MADEGTLQGKVALVTGAGRGIGASTAAHLARQGAKVVLAARTEEQLAKVAGAVAELRSEALPVVCDVSDEAQVERLFAEAAERFGPVDIVVNNAALLRAGPVHSLTRADWDAMLGVNLTGVLLCCRAALRQMLPRSQGVIVNVSSVSGISGVPKFPGLAAYAATKAGVIALSEGLAAEVHGRGVRVLAVSPGSVQTDMLAKAAPDAMATAMTPGQVGKVIAFLASDDGAAVNQTNVVLWGPPQAPPPKA